MIGHFIKTCTTPTDHIRRLEVLTLSRVLGLLDLLRNRELPFNLEQPLEFGQLPLEPHVWEDNWSSFTGV